MRFAGWAPRLVFVGLLSCGSSAGDAAPPPDSAPPKVTEKSPDAGTEPVDAGTPPPVDEPKIELNFVFVHGITQADSGRVTAHEQLKDLETAVVEHIAARGDDRLVVNTTRVNLYTDDNGELTSPRIDDPKDGTGLPAALAWRASLVKKTNAVFPTAKNIIFVGHSTGGRVTAEVGASEEMRDRVAGIVTIHGMIDKLQTTKYNLVGPTDYITGCSLFKPDGWCEYSGKISAVDALDWLARERHVLSLIGASSCSPSFWGGVNDQALPLSAQSSPWSPGLQLTPAQNATYEPAHGIFYGGFCHPDIVGGDKHKDAVEAASTQITKWLFDAAPRVVSMTSPDEPYEVPARDAYTFSDQIVAPGPCPDGRHTTGQVDVAGLCRHPGDKDGDDHKFDSSNETELNVGTQCDATLRVAHHHSGEQHAMRVWVKRYSLPEGGGLISTLH